MRGAGPKRLGSMTSWPCSRRVEVGLDEHQIGAGLDGQETTTGNVDTVGVLEVTDGGTDSGLELDDG